MAILIAIIGRSIDENEDGSALVALSGSVLARDIDETARMLFAEKPVVLTLGLAGEAVPADADAMAPATIAAQNEQIASMKKQLDESQAKLANEAWMHAACLSIAEGVKGWEDPIRPWQGVRDSAAMQAVRKLQADFIRARAQLVAKDEALAGVRESSLKKDEEIARLRELLDPDCIPDCELTGTPHDHCVQRKEQPRDLASPESLPSPIDAANSALAEMSDKIVAAAEAPALIWATVPGPWVCYHLWHSLDAAQAECGEAYDAPEKLLPQIPGQEVDAEVFCLDCVEIRHTAAMIAAIPDKQTGAAQEWPSPSSTTTKAPPLAVFSIPVLPVDPDADARIDGFMARQPKAPASGRILAPKDPQCEGMNNSAGTRCTSEGYKAVSTALGEMHWFCGRHNPNKPPRKTKETPNATP